MKFLFLSSHAHYALDNASTRVSGGAELQVALLSKELALRRHEVIIVGGDTGQLDGRMMEGVVTRNAGKFHTGAWLDTIKALPKVMGILSEYQPDYVAVLGWTAWLFILAVVRPFLGYKLIFICGLDTEIDGSFGLTNGWKGRLFERGVAMSDIRFAMSEYQRTLFGKLKLSCRLYRNLILPRKIPRETYKNIDLLWVGRCQRIKRPHLFLDLVERLPEASCEMICPREDVPLWEEISRRATTLPNLVFYERIPYHLIQEHYDRVLFLVSTSRVEGFPNVMIQALQGGAGIISLDLDPDGLIRTFDSGFCAGGDFEAMVAETSRLLADPSLCQSIGTRAEKILAEWLDNDRNTTAFLDGLEGPPALQLS